MPTDATYFPGVYKPQGDLKLVVGALGRLSMAQGTAAQSPTTGSLNANVTSAILTGNDWSGSISVVYTATPPAIRVALFVVTFAVARTTAPLVFVTSNGAAATAASYAALPSTTGFTLIATVAPVVGTDVVGYHLIDIE